MVNFPVAACQQLTIQEIIVVKYRLLHRPCQKKTENRTEYFSKWSVLSFSKRDNIISNSESLKVQILVSLNTAGYGIRV